MILHIMFTCPGVKLHHVTPLTNITRPVMPTLGAVGGLRFTGDSRTERKITYFNKTEILLGRRNERKDDR